MRFNDKYKKIMDQKSLSEDFIQDLCSKMTAAANQSSNDHKNTKEESDRPQILETRAIEYTGKKNTKNYLYIIASAAAILLICTAALKAISNKENLIVSPDDDKNLPPSVQVQTEASVTANVTDLPVVTKTADIIVTTPQTTEEKPENTIQEPQRIDGKFGTPDELMSFISSRKAEGSPVSVGYKKSGIQDLFSDFYNVNCSETSYSYSIKDSGLFKDSAMSYSAYDESGVVTQVNNTISYDELKQFNRIFSQIDKEAGQENYYIYDVYKFSYYSKADSSYGSGFINEESDNYRVEIVLKDYYSEYLNNPCRDNAVLSYEIRNDLDFNSDLTSEYQYFINEENQANTFYSEFTEKFSDCAITIGNVDTEYIGIQTYRPFTTWFRPSSGPDESYRYNIDALSNACYLPEKEGTPDADAPVYIYACLFFRPETDPEDINSKLKEMKPVFDKYKVLCVTVDILNSESDFNSYKNGNGFGDSDVVNSSYRRYCATYSDEFPEWSSK